MLEHGARAEKSQALRQAAENGRVGNARRLLDLGADMDEVATMQSYGPGQGVTAWGSALHVAAEHGQEERVRLLLLCGAKTDSVDGMA